MAETSYILGTGECTTGSRCNGLWNYERNHKNSGECCIHPESILIVELASFVRDGKKLSHVVDLTGK